MKPMFPSVMLLQPEFQVIGQPSHHDALGDERVEMLDQGDAPC